MSFGFGTTANAQPITHDDIIASVKEGLTTENCDLLRLHFDEAMIAAFSDEFCNNLLVELRSELGTLQNWHLRAIPSLSQSTFLFYLEFEKGNTDLVLAIIDNKIAGLRFLEARPFQPLLERNQTAMRLPMNDPMFIYWGGDTPEQNHHHGHGMQAFALDIVVADDHGNTRRGDANTNEDYYCFGKPVFATAVGVVTEAIDGVRDNEPGAMNPYMALGNGVMLKHNELETTVYAHLKTGSVAVRAGDVVEKGQLLGLCGNSGNSSEPHLHFHLQNSEILQNGLGIEVFFENVQRISPTPGILEEHNPVKGEIIQPNTKTSNP